MTGRPKDPKTARNKNVLVIGGSGSGKTRFYVKPNLMQCFPTSDYPTSFVVTDPKGTLVLETGQMFQRAGYRVKMHDFDTSMFFRWIFKSAFAILIVSNTWNIVMGVFDATQSVVNQSSGVIIGETSIHFDRLIPGLEFQLESMTIGSLLSLWFQTLVVGLTMNILSICIFLVTYVPHL